MKITEITFSPTGGTKKVADIICDALGEKTLHIDLSDPNTDFPEISCQLAVIAVPSFSGRVPSLALERLASLKGCGMPAVLVAVYGNREYEDTLLELSDAASNSGFETIAAIAAVAQHSVVPSIAEDRPDDRDKGALAVFAEKTAAKLATGSRSKPQIPGNRPFRSVGPATPPITNSDCEGCGICASKCPAQAISCNNPEEINPSLCIQCMRCVAICPKKAKSLPTEKMAFIEKYLKSVCQVRKEPELFL
ncbi:MAG: 4Fe-4S binding protein [Bacteroidales bacterium]|nr:4Fe-4S binding protein [Bacteroidales bacterium]